MDAGFNAGDAGAKGYTIADAAELGSIKPVAVPVVTVEFIVAGHVNATHCLQKRREQRPGCRR